MAEIMVLIAERSSKQGTSLNAGKLKEEYRQVISTVEMNVDDMQRLGLAESDRVRLRTGVGETLVHCKGRKADRPAGGCHVHALWPALQSVDGERYRGKRHADFQEPRAVSRGPGMG